MAGGVNARRAAPRPPPPHSGNAIRDGAAFPDWLTLRKTTRARQREAKQREEDAMAAVTRFTLGFVLAMAGCAAVSSADAATIAGTVTGPDGKGFRGAFVQARNL